MTSHKACLIKFDDTRRSKIRLANSRSLQQIEQEIWSSEEVMVVVHEGEKNTRRGVELC